MTAFRPILLFGLELNKTLLPPLSLIKFDLTILFRDGFHMITGTIIIEKTRGNLKTVFRLNTIWYMVIVDFAFTKENEK